MSRYFCSCRDRKTVVVAIRGTMSMADLVTDAVVHPEALAGWLPKATRKVREDPHSPRPTQQFTLFG